MKIVFLIPVVARLPIGGLKVVFEYANRLVDDGYQVDMLMSTSLITCRFTLKAVA